MPATNIVFFFPPGVSMTDLNLETTPERPVRAATVRSSCGNGRGAKVRWSRYDVVEDEVLGFDVVSHAYGKL